MCNIKHNIRVWFASAMALCVSYGGYLVLNLEGTIKAPKDQFSTKNLQQDTK